MTSASAGARWSKVRCQGVRSSGRRLAAVNMDVAVAVGTGRAGDGNMMDAV